MPELPEVETVRRGCEAHLPGRRLAAVTLRRQDLRWPIPAGRVRSLRGRRCTHVTRRSKYLLVHFDGPSSPVALIHLGMSGRLFIDVVRAGRAHAVWELHEHWRFDFGDRLVRYVDARRFGVLDATTERGLARHRLIANLGPEPLDRGFDPEYVFRQSRGRRVACKTFLMDARNVVGIGNIYASEACFRAGVRPRKAAGRLTRAQCERLVHGVREVLSEAVAEGGTTLRDYVGVEQNAGYFQRQLRVYGRAGESCVDCGMAIKRVDLGSRSTYYCAGCQA